MIYQQQLIIIMNLTNWVCYVCLCVSSPMRQLWIRTREFLIRWQPSGARRMRSCNWNWRTARRRAAPTWWRSTCWRRKARITWWLSARRTKPSQVLSNLSITADHNLQAFEERKIWSSVLTVAFLFLCHLLSEEIKELTVSLGKEAAASTSQEECGGGERGAADDSGGGWSFTGSWGCALFSQCFKKYYDVI